MQELQAYFEAAARLIRAGQVRRRGRDKGEFLAGQGLDFAAGAGGEFGLPGRAEAGQHRGLERDERQGRAGEGLADLHRLAGPEPGQVEEPQDAVQDAAFVRIRPDNAGRITARAGAAFLAVWLVAIGGRMVFAWAATQTSFGTTVGQFSREQLITGQQAWRAAFVIMALAMVLSRLLVLAVRTAQLQHAANRPLPEPAPTIR